MLYMKRLETHSILSREEQSYSGYNNDCSLLYLFLSLLYWDSSEAIIMLALLLAPCLSIGQLDHSNE